MDIQIILFDFGDTLVEIDPRLREESVQLIQAYAGRPITITDLKQAEREEWKKRTPKDFLWVQTKEDEVNYWQSFYRAVLDRLGITSHPPHLLKWLASVPTDPKSFVPFPEVKPVLDKLQEMGIALGIISNSFPSAEEILYHLELQPYFRYAVWSHRCGCGKPEWKIFHQALSRVNFSPAHILFLDDRVDFVKGAVKAGIRSAFWVNRNGCSDTEVQQIHSLWEIVSMVRPEPVSNEF
jgi:putative hydrolase of the HAD superfamily